MTGLVVAIDGPAGSGKSTVASGLAVALGVDHVDTGAYYRTCALAVLRSGADPDDAAACAAVARALQVTRRGGRTFLDGEDVEDAIRGADVTAVVSRVAGHQSVRRVLVAAQQAAVGPAGAVVEGRDAGTVVVPGAALKIWLTASPTARAQRRAAQLGITDPEHVDRLADDIAARDRDDADRMDLAPDAVTLDTTGLSIDEVVAELVARVRSITLHHAKDQS